LVFLVALGGCGDNASVPPGDAASSQDGGLLDGAPDGTPEFPVLRLGDVVDLPSGEGGAREIAFKAETGAEKYLAVLFSPTWTASGDVSYTVRLEAGFTTQSVPRNAQQGQALRQASLGSSRASPAHLADLPAVVQALHKRQGHVAHPFPSPPPQLGEIRSFKLLGDNRVVTVDAQAAHIGSNVVFWLDVTGDPSHSIPPAEISPEDMAAITSQYEDIVLPRERIFFGDESDVDGNGLVFVLLSAIVHENNGPTAYFYPCDLLAPGTLGCAYSNEAEILYLTPPNAIEPPFNTVRAIVEVMAHETNHMVFFNTKYLAHPTTPDVENMYLLEGWAALAQNLTGYQRGNKYVAWYGQNLIMDLSAYAILEDGGLYNMDFDGAWRGGSYLLQQYLYDRAGGDHALGGNDFEDLCGITWIRDIFNSGDTGIANLRARIPGNLEDVLFDFFTALAMTNRGPDHGPISSDPRFNYKAVEIDPVTGATRGHDAYGQLNPGMAMTGPKTFPLAEADGVMLPTGVEYLEFGAEQAGILRLRVEAAPEWALRVRLCRIE